MNITLTIQSEDYGFIVEAIKLRTTAILEGMSIQYDSQVLAANTPKIQQEIRQEVDRQFEKELAEWKIQTDGNKVVATHKPKAKRKVNAPYGLKKDGTPKKKPGPPVGF
jgi:hypothetical protein